MIKDDVCVSQPEGGGRGSWFLFLLLVCEGEAELVPVNGSPAVSKQMKTLSRRSMEGMICSAVHMSSSPGGDVVIEPMEDPLGLRLRLQFMLGPTLQGSNGQSMAQSRSE